MVREAQPTHWGWTPHHGVIEVRARMELGPRSMASAWLVGREEEPERCGEKVRKPHVYAADWRPGGVDFLVDGARVFTVRQAPDYPMQLMLGVFDFPAKGRLDHVPLLAVDFVRGRQP